MIFSNGSAIKQEIDLHIEGHKIHESSENEVLGFSLTVITYQENC